MFQHRLHDRCAYVGRSNDAQLSLTIMRSTADMPYERSRDTQSRVALDAKRLRYSRGGMPKTRTKAQRIWFFIAEATRPPQWTRSARCVSLFGAFAAMSVGCLRESD
jgi:hypothetical protein